MTRSLRFAFIMSTEVGLRTHYLNWREYFPTDMGIEPCWIVIDFWKSDGAVERLPLPQAFKARLRAQMELRDGLKKGPFDATLIGVHSALSSNPRYLRSNACYSMFDVTPKQLQSFGPHYGKYPSSLPGIETVKHLYRSTAFRECRLLFPWSRWAAESAVGDYGASSDRIRVAPPGVDLKKWMPAENRNRTDKKVCDILFVGGDFERKGGRILLDWARETKAAGWRLHIVTRVGVRVDDERVRVYTGLQSNDPILIGLYKQADLFALPTLADCYSIAGVEAMASALPVILSDVGGTADVVRDGETGYLVAPGDGVQFGQRMDELVLNPRKRRDMGDAARADAERRYDVCRNIRSILEAVKGSL